jgi:predicted dehydrogenase/threonine dehydrogenase-like Zn-dependent dehydrogenase
MKIIGQNYRDGTLKLLDAPAPACRPGGLLVRTEYSLISTGTETMKLREGRMTLLGKARARPDQVKKVLESVSRQGLVDTYRKVTNRLDSLTPLGYSLSGIVEEVGEGVEGFRPGERVACAGNQYALHAELNWVPLNLCVRVPEGVSSQHAAFGTVGAIAVHGVRRAEVSFGEVACVVGLGLIGQLVVAILRAASLRVVGLDPLEERCRLAERLGAEVCLGPGEDATHALRARVDELTDGHGCDHVFITASSESAAPVESASVLARDRARVVDIGKTDLTLPWNTFYEKELDLRLSRSYGPGRYDPRYEEGGIDYPLPYVRWTERRNIACFLEMVGEGSVDPEPLISRVFPFDDALDVYARLDEGGMTGVGFLFEYARSQNPVLDRDDTEKPSREADRRVWTPARRVSGSAPGTGGVIRVGAIGCGNFALSTLLPPLKKRKDVELVEVVTRSALSAANAAHKLGFQRMSTDHRGLLDDDIDVVFVLTPHGAHASLVCEALEAGKTVFVEKPLALTEAELVEVVRTVHATGNDRLQVGFNRRFSPLLTAMRGFWGDRRGPQAVHYRVNAGSVGRDSWYADAEGHGSRFAGEGGHFIDTISWWVGADPVEVWASSPGRDPDSLVATFRFSDQSLGTVSYLTEGHDRSPKELMEAFGGGGTARLDNFRMGTVWRGGRRRRRRSLVGADKGHEREMDAFLRAVRDQTAMPIPLDSLVATTHATLQAARSITSGRTEEIVTSASGLLSRAGEGQASLEGE